MLRDSRPSAGSTHLSVNGPLRNGCTPEAPHPYAATVTMLVQACNKLRKAAGTAAAVSGASAASVAASVAAVPLRPPQPPPLRTLWRGVRDPALSTALMGEFLQRGGCELGFLSASTERAVAERYAERSQAATPSTTSHALLLLKLSAPDLPQHRGAAVGFLSAFPGESECLFPPGTYLRPVSREPSLVVSASAVAGGNGGVRLVLRLLKIVEVLPIVQCTVV